MQQTSVPASTRARTLGASCGLSFARRVAPKATILAFFHVSCRAAWKKATSLGLDPGQLARDAQLVVEGIRDALALRAVAQRGVEGLNGVGQGSGHGVMG